MLLGLACMLVFLQPATATAGAQDIELHVIAGQSNAQGVKGDAAGYPLDPDGADPGIMFFYRVPGADAGGRWTSLGPQSGLFAGGHFGPEITFARALAREGRHPAIFKFSKGSTGLARDWRRPGEGGLYDEMCASLEAAMAALKGQGHPVELRSLVWLQGESDAETPALAAEYHDRLALLLDDFRRRFGVPELPVILGVDEAHPWVRQNPEVAAAQQRLAGEKANVGFCGMTGLAKADTSHLTPEGLAAHGERLFEALIRLGKEAPR